MRQTLNVDIKNDKQENYEIVISDDLFSKLKEDIDLFTSGANRLVVISQKVYKLYKKELNFDRKEVFVLKDGEIQKNFKNYEKILKKAFDLGLTRKDYIIAVGGGVVGDIAGFAASTYMRGINFVQVSTTLLSMVDSSVGGKTAIDIESGKNIVGAFYQPKKVFININFLKTLDKKQYKSGLGEILKYAFIDKNCGYKQDLFFFEYLTLCADKLIEKETMTLMRVIENCLLFKSSVVNQDEKEAGLRKVLNFGHTLGHALEAYTNYKKFTHGEAVVYGMFFIFAWAYSRGMIAYSYYRMAEDLLIKYGFKGLDLTVYSKEGLIDLMKHDKKATSDKISFIVSVEKRTVKEILLSIDEVKEMF